MIEQIKLPLKYELGKLQVEKLDLKNMIEDEYEGDYGEDYGGDDHYKER